MATQFFLRAEGGPATSAAVVDRTLALTRGSGISILNTDTTTSGNHLLIDVESSSNAWAIKVKACTISGTITFNFWGSESSMNNNAQFACVISRYDSAGNFISDVVAQGNANHADGVELGTTAAAMNWTATPTNTTFAEGDILVVIPHVDAIGTMAAASNGVAFNYGGTTAGANADTYVTFTETITPYNRPHAQAQAHIKGISRGFGQAQCFIPYRTLSDGFNNNATNGWGTADSNGSIWESSFSQYSVTSGIANVASFAGFGADNTVDNMSVGKFEGLMKFRTSSMSLDGAAISFVSHWADSSNSNRAELALGTTNTYRAKWRGGNTQNGTLPSITPNSWYWFRAEIIGNGVNSTDFRFKVWADGTVEPDWGQTLSQSSGTYVNSGGKIGVGFIQNGTTGQTFDLDEVWINTFPGYGQAAALISSNYTYVQDNFNRTVSDQLGTASTSGGAYTLTGPQIDDTNFEVDGSKALIRNDDTPTQAISLLETLNPKNIQISAQVSVDKFTSTLAPFVTFFSHASYTTDYLDENIQFLVQTSSGHNISVALVVWDNLAVSTSPIAYTLNDVYNIAAQFLATSTEYIAKVKIWKVGDTEPVWETSAPITLPARFSRGYPGITTGFNNDANVPFTWTVDNLLMVEAWPTGSGQAQALITSGHFGSGQAQARIAGRYETEVRADSPISYWRMDEASGNIQDSKGTNHATLTGGTPTYGVRGAISADPGKSITFNGTTNYFKIPDDNTLDLANGPLTYEMWLKRSATDPTNYDIPFSKNFQGNLFFRNDKFRLDHEDSNNEVVLESGSTTDFNWHHWVVTRSGAGTGNTKVYKDGVDVTSEGPGIATSLTATATDLYIGAYNNSGTPLLFFPGSIDEVAIYNSVLSPTRVRAHYEAAITLGSGQAQTDIKALGRGFGQAQVDIKAVNRGFGQTQADILTQGYGSGQAQVAIKAFGFGQAQALLNQAFKFGQAQAAIKHGGSGQTAAAISGDYTIPFDDTFTRTTSNSLGTSDNGDSWVLAQGVASNFSTDGSKANIIWPTSAPANIQELKRTLISTPSGIQISTKFSIDKVLGSALQANIFLGLNRTIISPATTDIVAMRITLDTNVDLSVTPVAFNQSGTSAVGSTNYTPNDVYNAKAHILNASNNTLLLKVKIWKDGDAEPGWTRSSVTGHLTPKHPAIEISNISDTNSPITFSLDNFNIIEAWHTESGQAQARIKTTYRQHAQAQADIKQTYFGSGQAQAEIVLSIVTISAVAQAQADIKQTYFGLGQSQADILATYYGLGQAQADIKAAGNGLGQANADIKATGNGLGQAQADIQVTYSQFGQANADILATNFAFGQAQTDIKTTYFGLGQSQADILTQGYGLGQANADIKAVNNGSGQAQTDILAVYSQVAQAQADIKQTYYQVAQAQADIKTTYFGSGQSQADIKQTYWGLANAQADILAVGNAFGQAMATIVGNAYGQAQTDIQATYWGSGQAETWIKTTYYGSGQANASIKGAIQQFAQAQASILTAGYAVAQSQADIKQTYNAFGQSQADILQTYTGCGQAQATIVGNAFGQAQTDVLQTYTQSAQAQADILVTTNQSAQANADIKTTSNGVGQANSDILAVISQHAQAQVDILVTQNGSGQANSDIKQTQTGSGQSQADIKSTYFGSGQAQADILAAGYGSGQSNADILATNTGHGQAQADILQTYSQFGQAQADIQQIYTGSGQANADIKAVGYGSGQAQGDILQTYNQHGQTQADILATNTGSGQSQTDILAIQSAFGQTQADILVTQSGSGQAQSDILASGYGLGQAQSDIKTQGYGSGQAQAKINAFDQNASGQAQTNIKFEGTAGSGQAQAKLNAFDVNASGQSQADIKAVNAGYGQANSDIKAQGYGLGQAQSDIQVITSQSAQANTDIKQTNSQFGQAQTDILATQIGSGQAQGDIKAVNNGFGQSQADIKAINYGSGQAQCSIQTARSSSGQATADIKAIVSSCGQSQASIRATYNSFGQAQASIRVSNTTYGQAQGLITQTGQGYGQANVDIKSVINRFGQANSDILATNNKSGNAQADVKTTVNTSGQTQALIRRAQDAYAQAQATIQSGSRGVGQAQTWVKVTDIIAVAQTQALILKSAGYGQATAMIHQPHTLRKVAIGDLSLIDLALGSRAVPNLINSDRVEKVHVGDRSGIGLKVSDQD